MLLAISMVPAPRRHSTTGTAPDAVAAQASLPSGPLIRLNGLWCFDPGLQAFVQRFPGESERERADGVDGVEVTATDREPFPGVLAVRWEGSEEHTSELQSPCNLVCRR